jgi:4'-phosphopantetheinyl transferase EntD
VQLTAGSVAGLFPDGAIVEVAEPALHLDDLFDEERAQVVRAVDKRKAEYATARLLARRALERLGVGRCPVVNDDSRCPVWPLGIVGSIAHTRGVCAVVVARRGPVESLGLDVEVDEPVRPELFERICTNAELAWVDAEARADKGSLVKLFFSAKEAFYKCQYPITRQYLGFHDVEATIDLAGGRFEVELRHEAGPLAARTRFVGLHRRVAGFVVTAVAR